MKEKRTIILAELFQKDTKTWSVKDDSVRGCKTMSIDDIKIGDKVVINNYFTEIISSINEELKITIKQDIEYYEKLQKDLLLQHYFTLYPCNDVELSKMWQLCFDGNLIWAGTLEEINAIVKSFIKIEEIKEDK